ncbi:MAG: hypothetical protein A4E40_01055 [Methanoregulaceae archaeon PtaU1.Bin059]|nr:MAG: hypothetical protein A4E40_01055 [Methanoregulaceae archaeon PtaU1.Bin059]
MVIIARIRMNPITSERASSRRLDGMEIIEYVWRVII